MSITYAQINNGAEVDEGAAFLYLGGPSGPSPSRAWTAEGDQIGANFGGTVATVGDVNADGYWDVVVGADEYTNPEIAEGQVFVYYGSSSGLPQLPNWTARGGQAVAGFGSSVSTAGDVNGDGYSDLIVGSHLYDDGQADEGAVFVFHGSASGLDAGGTRPQGTPASADWRAASDQVSADFGTSVASAGDVNGDGYADVILGSRAYENDEVAEGAAFVYFGSASGLGRGGTRVPGTPSNADWHAEGNQASSDFGAVVAGAGDVNDDNYADVIVGAPRYDDPQTDEGRATLYLGSSGGLSDAPGWTADGNQNSAQLGFSVSSAGDVNGDGYADVIVGAPYYDNYTDSGLALLYLGSPVGLATTSAWSVMGDRYSEYFGYSVSSAGDVNGDGYGDVVVGAPNRDSRGAAYVYLGSAAGLDPSAVWSFTPDQYSSWFGYSVAGAGDVDGDGYADVLIGARYYDNGQSDEGRAYLFRGSGAGPWRTPSWTAECDQNDAYFGNSVSTAGDVNGDGYSDVIVGALGFNGPYGDGGRAFLYLGSPAGLSVSPSWTADGDYYSVNLGQSVSSAGDLDGDGFSDVIVGAPYAYDAGRRVGKALVYAGSPVGLSTGPTAVLVGPQENVNSHRR